MNSWKKLIKKQKNPLVYLQHIYVSEKKRTTFGPSQLPCNETKTKVSWHKMSPLTLNKKENIHNPLLLIIEKEKNSNPTLQKKKIMGL